MKRLLITVLFMGCSSGGTPPAPASAAPAVVAAETTPLVEADPGYVGVLMPAAAVDVAPGYEGEIAKIHVKVGAHVAEGGSIATFDSAAAQEALKMAKAELRMAKGEAAQAAAASRHARRKLKTERQLFAQGWAAKEAVSDAHADRMKAGAATSTAAGRIGAAKAQIEQLERQLEETDLTAPFAGQVAIVYREAGAMADPGRPVARLIDTSSSFVRFAVPPPEAVELALGAEVDVIVDWLPEPMRATIREISPEVDAPTGLVFAEAELIRSHLAHVKPHSPAWVRLR